MSAEFEINMRRERQMRGIAAAGARGVHKRRSPKIDPGEVSRLHEQNKLSPTVIARRLGIARSTGCWFLPGAEDGSQ